MSYLVDFLETKKNRWNMRENKNAIIGVEIRRKRLIECLTLNGLCHNICSPSYLCKIERNQIEANHAILGEILERMSISGNQQDMLFNFYDVLIESITLFVKDDKKKLEEYIDLGRGFENYRYRILSMIYCIATNNIPCAKEIYNEIKDILGGMQDVDLLIYSVFSAILKYKEKSYQEAIDILSELNGLFLSNDLSFLRNKYMYLSSLMLASYEAKSYYDDYIKDIIRLGYYDQIEEAHYSMALFYLKSESYRLFYETIKLLHNEKNINSIKFLLAYKDMDYEMLYDLKDKPMNPFCEYLVDTLTSNDARLEVIRHLSNCCDSFDFNTDILKYYTYKTPEARLSFLMSLVNKNTIPGDIFVCRFFLRELAALGIDKGHYKETVFALNKYSEKI